MTQCARNSPWSTRQRIQPTKERPTVHFSVSASSSLSSHLYAIDPWGEIGLPRIWVEPGWIALITSVQTARCFAADDRPFRSWSRVEPSSNQGPRDTSAMPATRAITMTASVASAQKPPASMGMSASGAKRKSASGEGRGAFGSKTDIVWTARNFSNSGNEV